MNLSSSVNYMAGHCEENRSAPPFFVLTAAEVAQMVVDAQRLGVIDGWRAYIRDQQIRSGVSNDDLTRAIAQLKDKQCE